MLVGFLVHSSSCDSLALFAEIWALWRSGLSTRVAECQKLKM